MADDTLTISFRLTDETCSRFFGEHYASSPRWRRHDRAQWRRFRKYFAVAAAFTGAAAGMLVLDIAAVLDVREGVLVAAHAIAALGLIVAVSTHPWRERAARLQRIQNPYGAENPYVGDHVFRIGPRGLELRRAAATVQWTWPGIVEVSELPAGVSFGNIIGEGMIVPRNAFASEREYHQFVELARTLHAASGFDPPGRMIDFLQHNDFRCPGCGRNLRGGADRKCPGCSLPLDFHAVPEAMRHVPRAAAADPGSPGSLRR